MNKFLVLLAVATVFLTAKVHNGKLDLHYHP